ncbi:MAG: DinB family protein [Gemmatimonadetes bacterium]|nr:DinB family protein [Gemmatimonadota bacterium]
MDYALDDALAVLERTPATLRALLAGLPLAWTTPDEGPDTFSAWENVGHMLHGEHADWIPRARVCLGEGPGDTFQPFDRFAHRTDYAGRTLESLLDEFAAARAANLALVRSWQLTDAQLARTAQHPALGTVTMRQLMATWVVHDLGHVAQIARVMAKQYRDEVGPWRQYLPILDRR